jgi:hypothetical protein
VHSCRWPLHLRGQRFTSESVQSTVLSCNLTFVYRFQGGVGLLAGLTVLFVAAAVALVVRCRRTLVPSWFDPDSQYRTLYDASEAAVSLNRVNGNDADVDETAPDEAGAEAEYDDPAAGVTEATQTVTRPLVASSARGSARCSAKKRNKPADV